MADRDRRSADVVERRRDVGGVARLQVAVGPVGRAVAAEVEPTTPEPISEVGHDVVPHLGRAPEAMDEEHVGTGTVLDEGELEAVVVDQVGHWGGS